MCDVSFGMPLRASVSLPVKWDGTGSSSPGTTLAPTLLEGSGWSQQMWGRTAPGSSSAYHFASWMAPHSTCSPRSLRVLVCHVGRVMSPSQDCCGQEMKIRYGSAGKAGVQGGCSRSRPSSWKSWRHFRVLSSLSGALSPSRRARAHLPGSHRQL